MGPLETNPKGIQGYLHVAPQLYMQRHEYENVAHAQTSLIDMAAY